MINIGKSKTIFASAPGRIGLLGDPSDINGGCVISMAIDLRAHVSVEHSDRFAIEGNGKVETSLAFNQTHDLVKACIKRIGLTEEQVKIKYWTEIPFLAGLGGSSAICVACLGALREYFGLDFNNFELAEKATLAELKELDIIAGQQDRYISTFGGTAFMDFKGKEMQKETDLLGKLETLPVKDIPLFIAPVQRKVDSGSTLRTFREGFLKRDKTAVEINQKFIALAKAGKEYLLNENWREFGKLMIENKLLEDKISPPTILESNSIYENALAAGAFGARTSGSMSTTLILGNKDVKKKLVKLYPGQQFLEPKPSNGLRVETREFPNNVKGH